MKKHLLGGFLTFVAILALVVFYCHTTSFSVLEIQDGNIITHRYVPLNKKVEKLNPTNLSIPVKEGDYVGRFNYPIDPPSDMVHIRFDPISEEVSIERTRAEIERVINGTRERTNGHWRVSWNPTTNNTK